MAEPANAGDGNPLTGLGFGLLDAFVGSDAGADERRGFLWRQAGGDVCYVIWIGEEVLGETAIFAVAAKLRLGTDRFPRA